MLSLVARYAVLGLCLPVTSVQAASFQITPVRLTLSATQLTTAFTVTSQSAQQVVVQLRIVAWTQQEEKDVYVDTREIIVTPPIFRLEPEGTQTVRLGLQRPAPARQELAYRVYVQEVPMPLQPGFEGIQIALQVRIPVFVQPGYPAAPILRWRAQQTPEGAVRLRLDNDGNSHVQVQELRLWEAQHAEATVALREATYILPGQTRQWLIASLPTTRWTGQRLHIFLQTDQGVFNAEIDVEVP